MRIRTDILVIGAGGAGARAAIEAANTNPEQKILILNQGPIGKSGLTSMANGGMQYVSHPDDSPLYLFEDIVRIGAYLNDQNLIEVLKKARRGPGSWPGGALKCSPSMTEAARRDPLPILPAGGRHSQEPTLFRE